MDTEEKRQLNSKPERFSHADVQSALSGKKDDALDNILPNGHTIAETNILAVQATEELHREAFAKGQPMFYQDERSGTEYYIRANPDGSEDLVSYQLADSNCTVIRQLLPAGKGYWSYLIDSI